MNDNDVLHNINALMAEEHALLRRSEQHNGLSDEDEARLNELKVSLDQCWDLLRQRRARREFGENPGEAKVRDASTVEHYDQ